MYVWGLCHCSALISRARSRIAWLACTAHRSSGNFSPAGERASERSRARELWVRVCARRRRRCTSPRVGDTLLPVPLYGIQHSPLLSSPLLGGYIFLSPFSPLSTHEFLSPFLSLPFFSFISDRSRRVPISYSLFHRPPGAFLSLFSFLSMCRAKSAREM